MTICIKENEFNPSFIALYGEEKARQMGFTIVEIPQGYEDCIYEDFDDNFSFSVEKYNKRKQAHFNQKKLSELTNWFGNYFDKQLNQSLWQDDFNISHDEYFNKDYTSLNELKEQAKVVRAKIQELRKGLTNSKLKKTNITDLYYTQLGYL